MGFPHHGPEDEAARRELMKRFEDQVEGRAQRAYSEGRLGAEDLGDLAAVISTDRERKRIRLDFGKPVTWLAMTADDAVSLAQELIKRAREIAERPFTIEL
jgi:hypothetical protein